MRHLQCMTTAKEAAISATRAIAPATPRQSCDASGEAGACSAPGCDQGTEVDGWRSCNYAYNRETHPVNFVSWTQMREFGAWAGADLPTEAQWEFAARSRGQEITYPWGDQEPDCTANSSFLLVWVFMDPKQL